jgi:hypothetical protein
MLLLETYGAELWPPVDDMEEGWEDGEDQQQGHDSRSSRLRFPAYHLGRLITHFHSLPALILKPIASPKILTWKTQEHSGSVAWFREKKLEALRALCSGGSCPCGDRFGQRRGFCGTRSVEPVCSVWANLLCLLECDEVAVPCSVGGRGRLDSGYLSGRRHLSGGADSAKRYQ